MNTEELIAAAEGLVKELQGRINGGGMDLQEAEAKILEMVNWIGDAMVQEVVAGLDEPTSANQITVGGEVAVFERVRNLRFINRFGEGGAPAALLPVPEPCRRRGAAGCEAGDRRVLRILTADDVPDLHAGRR